MATEYDKLDKYSTYDKEAAEQYAAAKTELIEISKRGEFLKQLLDDNEQIRPFVWTTADGKAIALHQIEDSHLKNIMLHIINRTEEIPKAIAAEAARRSMTVPGFGSELLYGAISDGEDNDIDLDELPF